MKVTIEAGTRGWFDSVTFKRDSTVDVESYRTFCYKTNGQIADLHSGYPAS
jgi:hypothetical protein